MSFSSWTMPLTHKNILLLRALGRAWKWKLLRLLILLKLRCCRQRRALLTIDEPPWAARWTVRKALHGHSRMQSIIYLIEARETPNSLLLSNLVSWCKRKNGCPSLRIQGPQHLIQATANTVYHCCGPQHLVQGVKPCNVRTVNKHTGLGDTPMLFQTKKWWGCIFIYIRDTQKNSRGCPRMLA